MKTEHYLAAVSKAIDAHEAAISEAFETHSRVIAGENAADPLMKDAYDAVFMARIGASYLTMMDTINNLRKWPRT